MVCGYLTAQMILTTLCVIWKVTDTMMEHYYDKRLLEWLDRGLAPPPPKIVLDKQSGSEQWAIWKLAASIRAPKNLELGPDISQEPVLVIVTISFTIISHILYRSVSHSLLL